ncbi:MAG: hypothetical protein LC641_03925 [Spirochaeta sp.]|nr:hypothetical protein [Spirochaeta sp.]
MLTTSPAFGIGVAIVVGVIGTSVIHLSKGIMKLGIMRMREDKAPAAPLAARVANAPNAAPALAGRGRSIYIAGILMNFTNPLWVIIANRFAPTVYYTSMYGLGLVSLLVFSRLILGEHLDRRRITGALIVVAGTLLIGAARITSPASPLFLANRTTVLVIAGAWALAAPAIARLMRGAPIPAQELMFGLLGGGLAAMEAVLKGVSQSVDGAASFLPGAGPDWWIFAVSFLGAAGAFGMIQWSYIRSCRVAIMAASYDVSYVALPLLVTALAVSGERVNALSVLGLVVLGTGAFFTQGASASPSLERGEVVKDPGQ